MSDSALAILEHLLAAPAEMHAEQWARSSRDFYDADWTYDEVAALEGQFAAAYRALVGEVVAHWGAPTFAGGPGACGFPAWSGAAELTYWHRKSRLACIWWEHQDKELPISLGLCASSEDEAAVVDDEGTLDTYIRRAIDRGVREGLQTLDPTERLVFLISEAEVLCDMEGIDSFIDSYGASGLQELAEAFASIGAVEIAAAARSANLDLANQLITKRAGYSYDSVRAFVSRCIRVAGGEHTDADASAAPLDRSK